MPTTKHATMNARIVFLLFLTTIQPIFRTQRSYSRREGEGLRFNVHERSPQRAHASVEVSRFDVLQIDKEAPYPARQMLFKELAIGAGRHREIATDQTCHDFRENGDVILRLRMPVVPFNAEMLKGFAQPRQRASVERARQIMRCIRQQRALPEPGEQIKILTRRACLIGSGRGLREIRMCGSEQACVAAQQGHAFNHCAVRTARKQDRQKRILLRTGAIDLIDDAMVRNVGFALLHVQSYRGKALPCERCRGSSSISFSSAKRSLLAAAPSPSPRGEPSNACCDLSSGATGSSPVSACNDCSTDTGISEIILASLSFRPSAWAKRAGKLSLSSRGPKPGIESGSLKSHWFSAMPMKSRMAGSLAQAWRNAARVNSAGTRLCRKPRMSVSTVIVSIDGRLAGSKGSSTASIRGCAKVASAPHGDASAAGSSSGSPAGSILRWISALRFNRAQRETKASEVVTSPSPVRCRGGQAPIPPAP